LTAGRWLAIVISLVALLGGGYATWRLSTDRDLHLQREAALKDTLQAMRKAIDAFHDANGRYPRSLQELVPKYLRHIPVDPVTHRANWRLITEQTVTPSTDFTTSPAQSETYVIGVQSAAGKPYSDW
jgi:hypothetical protein